MAVVSRLPSSAASASIAEAVRAVGLLDEGYWLYMEDLDWCRRFWAAGWKVFYEPAGVAPGLPGRELLVAELDTGPLVRPVRVRAGQRRRHVEVVGTGRERAGEDRHHEPRIDRVEHMGDPVCPAQVGDRRGGRRVHPVRHEPAVAEPGDHLTGPVGVVVGHHEPLEEVPASGDAGGCGAHATGADQ